MATVEGVSLPEDLIIYGILPWLPAKSLVRFRSVCKAWNSAIPTRRFAELHRERSQPRICKLAASSSWDDADRYCPDFITVQRRTDDGFLECCYFRMPWLEGCNLVASSGDLIVFSYKAGYLLSNPATEDLLDLPPASWDDAGYTYPQRTGYGFVPSLGKYKLVSITFGAEGAHMCEVFTVGIDDSWRRVKPPPFPVDASYSTPHLNGNLRMLSYDSIDFADFKDENRRVLVFNLEEETWSAKALPGIAEKTLQMAHQLREMRGFLCFICCIPGKTIDVWMMRDYANNVWSKDFVIDGTHLDLGIKKKFYGVPLEVMSDGRIFVEMTDGRWYY